MANNIPRTPNSPLLGWSQPETGSYAPADFADSELTRPVESYFDSGSQSPATVYSSTIQNTLQKHVKEVRDKHTSPIQYSNQWKKKLRDIFVRGNDTVLRFLTKPTSANPTFNNVEQIIRKFSRPDPLFSNSNQLLCDLVTDLSGTDVIDVINQKLISKVTDNPTVTLGEQVKCVYDLYKDSMEDIIRKENILASKLQILDKVQPRLTMLLDLGVDETTADLEKQIEVYLEKVYKENSPEVEYREMLLLYKKMLVIRDLMNLLRLSSSPDREPLCGICLNDSVAYAISPCGHTYCENCVKRILSSCFICRQPCSQRIKLFFS